MAEARAYMEGERKGFKVTLPETVDARGLRKRLSSPPLDRATCRRVQ